jgi:hypothetical protein
MPVSAAGSVVFGFALCRPDFFGRVFVLDISVVVDEFEFCADTNPPPTSAVMITTAIPKR